jgi:hydantoinase/carbamoylase family amidase
MIVRASVVERLAELAKLGAYEGGIDRGLFTEPEHAARNLFAGWASAAGFAISQDRAGNLFARREGRSDRAPIVVGSHLDTVRTGGPYDGAYGVVGALCALERLSSDRTLTSHPLEAVAWAGEEGSRFPMGCLGSGAYAGLNSVAAIESLVGDDGVRFIDARAGAGGLLRDIPVRESFPRPAACVELHIEQGPIMERAGVRLGVVTAIAGQVRAEVEVRGESGHAGTVPMIARHDALAAAAEIVLALEILARQLGECVVTVGHLLVEPNQTNVIPGRVAFRVDARSVDDERVDRLEAGVRDECSRMEIQRGVKCAIKILERRAAVPMDGPLRAAIHETLGGLRAAPHETLGGLRAAQRDSLVSSDLKIIDISSGAGHDTMCIATIAPAAMIFVPSVGGRSHVGNEHTSPEDLELGVEALTRSIVAIDRLLAQNA